ncbi:MAG: hypothetical protein J0M04_15630 [Verrucomicrobia bacterium]|nr:hypothetical protein [Verrucomicrobiota bacterium]
MKLRSHSIIAMAAIIAAGGILLVKCPSTDNRPAEDRKAVEASPPVVTADSGQRPPDGLSAKLLPPPKVKIQPVPGANQEGRKEIWNATGAGHPKTVRLSGGQSVTLDVPDGTQINAVEVDPAKSRLLVQHNHKMGFRLYNLDGKSVAILPKFDQVFDPGHFHGVLEWRWLDSDRLVASATTGPDLSKPIPPAQNGPVREDYFPFDIRFIVYDVAGGRIRELEIPGRAPGRIVRLESITQDGLLVLSEAERVFHPGDGLPVEPSGPNAWKPLGAFRVPN